MPLVPVQQLLFDAQSGGYALGYFESWNLESFQGTLDAAEQTRSPIIIGVNGEFLTHGGRTAAESVALWGAVGRAAAAQVSVPCGLIFNECSNDATLRQAVEVGFNLIMPADPAMPYEAYIRWVHDMVEYARPRGAAVEAELGELPSGLPGEDHVSSTTDPRQAAEFARATGVDLLSVSVGNVHILVEGQKSLDFDLLARLRSAAAIPLGLHGGTGIPAEDLRRSARFGVAKVNFGTYLKQRWLAALRRALASDEINPHRLVGLGGDDDVLVAGRLAVREAVLERIEFLGCCGRAK